MILDINIVMDNAAFGETGGEVAAEMNRILNYLAGHFETVDIENGEHLNIRDINGNSVGSLNITPT